MMVLSHRLPFLIFLGLLPNLSNSLEIVGGATPADDKLVDSDGRQVQVDLEWRSIVSAGRELQAQPVCAFTLSDGTRVELDEGESFGNLLSSPCGSSADWPCFCDSSEADLIRCPYCPFFTDDQTWVCAQSGESIKFMSIFGFQQNCTCDYLGNNEFDSTCSPSNIPSAVCALQRNTDRCPELTANINFDPNCNCLTFCDGQLLECCPFGQTCQVTCPAGVALDQIVSGCIIDPFKPPLLRPTAAPVPTPSPPPAGTMPQSCMLELNPQNCPGFMANLPATLPSNCGSDSCYNFCNDRLQGCCALDDATCSLQCQGVTQAVITAGCRVDGGDTNPVPMPTNAPAPVTTPTNAPAPVTTPTNPPVTTPAACELFGQPCESNSDCCSDRCFVGSCARPGLLGVTRTKLSGTRGGEGGVSNEGNRQLLDEEENNNDGHHHSKIRGTYSSH